MTSQHIETLITGGGQAGLATDCHLKQLGREFLILDGNARVGDNWRCHWTRCGCSRRRSTTGFRACCFPATHGRSTRPARVARVAWFVA
jgi:cation diffusion facilitator CzcD-associated flavoprotein CzcO